jgi:uncharacterized damage-inducible protein DinB
MTTAERTTTTTEQSDLLDVLAKHRHFLRFTTRDITDEQARTRTTASELTLGGLIKHVAAVEANWADFIVNGPAENSDPTNMTEEDFAKWADNFRLRPDETLAEALENYAEIARRTDALVTTLPDLNATHPLPTAPWFEPGARWSARRVLMHIIAETAQHAGHADIIRESLDGKKSMS